MICNSSSINDNDDDNNNDIINNNKVKSFYHSCENTTGNTVILKGMAPLGHFPWPLEAF